MHICPAEIGAALILFDQMKFAYWYLIWRSREILEDWRPVHIPKDGGFED